MKKAFSRPRNYIAKGRQGDSKVVVGDWQSPTVYGAAETRRLVIIKRRTKINSFHATQHLFQFLAHEVVSLVIVIRV